LEEYGAVLYITKDLDKLKQNYPESIEHSRKNHWVKNFKPYNYVYECYSDDGNRFFVAEEKVSDREIVYSLCMIDPNLFSLRDLDILSYDSEDTEKKIKEFILNKNLNMILEILFKNIFGYGVREKYVLVFIERVKEFITKV